jgi:hypothetical protein
MVCAQAVFCGGGHGGAHLVQQRVVLLVVALGELLEPLEQVGLRLAAQQRRRARPPLELVEALARLPAAARARAPAVSHAPAPPARARAPRAGAAPSRHPPLPTQRRACGGRPGCPSAHRCMREATGLSLLPAGCAHSCVALLAAACLPHLPAPPCRQHHRSLAAREHGQQPRRRAGSAGARAHW